VTSDPFSSSLVDTLLPSDNPFRGKTHILASASSTQDLARKSREVPSVWAAEIQTTGRGRQGHRWASDHPLGLWCSVLLEPAAPLLPLLSMAGSLAAADAVRGLTGIEPLLKWPNDLLVKNRKLAGLLVETVARPGHLPLAILGLGLNLAQQTADFPRELRPTAVSLRQASGRTIPRAQMLAAFLDALPTRLTQSPGEIIGDFSLHWGQQGRTVRIRSGEQEFTGRAERVDESGHLCLRLPDGSTRSFASGETDFPA